MDEIKNIINDVIKDIAGKKYQQQNKIERIWQNIEKELDLKHTAVSGEKDGILTVCVDSPTYLYQCKIQKTKILKRLQEEFDNIKNIHFKLGKV